MPSNPVKVNRTRKRRGEIIDAAAAVFSAKGYHGANTTDIAQRLGMRQASLYYYFRSKEEALAEVCEIGVGDYVQNLKTIVAGRTSAATKLRAMVQAHMQPFYTRTDYVRVFLRDRYHVPQPRRQEIRRLTRQYEKLVEEILREGKASGELSPSLDPRISALAIIGLCNAAAFLYNEKRNGPIKAFADKYADLAIFGALRRP
jgi:AcrR family transcriptional regulator